MPNHITNILTLKGSKEDIEKCFESIKGINDGEKMLIDFNKIIPQPDSLNITSGSSVENAIAIIKNDQSYFQNMLDYPWVINAGITSIEVLIEKIKSNLTEKDFKEGQISIENEQKYGYRNWYDWSIANWGTKWNSYDNIYLTPESIQFDTAWSTPFPVMCELSKKFPNLIVEVFYADEDIGSNCGSYTLKEGNLVSEYCPEGYEAMKFAYKVKGMDEGGNVEIISNSITWVRLDELKKMEDDIVEVLLNNESVDEQKNIIDEWLNCIKDYGNDKEERIKFLTDIVVNNEFYEVAQHLTEKLKETN